MNVAPRALTDIQADVERMAGAIAAPGSLLPTYARSEDSARPHIEVNESGYHYVVVERGEELSRLTTAKLDELLYAIFQSVTFSMACDFEGRSRLAGRDPRRLIFQHQVELLGQLEPLWARRLLSEQDRILQRHPFRDAAF